MSLRRPPPMGVDVSSRWIAVAQVERGRRVSAAACIARTRQGQPDSAELARLADVLDRRGFRGTDVVLAAPEDRLITAALELPPRSSGAPVDDLAKMELARTHKLNPGSFEAALWDVPGGGGGRATEGAQYMAAALGHDDADSLIAAFEGAGLRVRAVDARAWALARVCAPRTNQGVSALLDLGETGALLVLVQDGSVVYQRALPEAGVNRLRTGLASSLGLAPEVIEFVLGGGGSGPDGLPEGAASILDEYVEAIAAEARAAFEYVARRANGAGVERLLGVGAGARVPSVVARLGNATGVDADAAPPGGLLECPGGVADVCRDPRLTAAVGLAIHAERRGSGGGAVGGPRAVRGVNLIPARRRTARERRLRITMSAGVVAVYAMMLGGVYAWLVRTGTEAHDWEAQVSGVRTEIEGARQEAARARAEIVKEESALRASAAVQGQPDWSMLFALIARKAGDAIWIESAGLSSPPSPDGRGANRAAGAGGSKSMILSIAGLGESQSGVSAFVLGLEEAGLFSRVSLLETRRQAHNEREVMAFRVECLLEMEP